MTVFERWRLGAKRAQRPDGLRLCLTYVTPLSNPGGRDGLDNYVTTIFTSCISNLPKSVFNQRSNHDHFPKQV